MFSVGNLKRKNRITTTVSMATSVFFLIACRVGGKKVHIFHKFFFFQIKKIIRINIEAWFFFLSSLNLKIFFLFKCKKNPEKTEKNSKIDGKKCETAVVAASD